MNSGRIPVDHSKVVVVFFQLNISPFNDMRLIGLLKGNTFICQLQILQLQDASSIQNIQLLIDLVSQKITSDPPANIGIELAIPLLSAKVARETNR